MLKQNESELLSAYLDKELTGEELTRVQEHLTRSIEWREELERLQKTKNLAMALPPVPAPADLLDFLENQAATHAQTERVGFWKFLFPGQLNIWTWAGPLATAALVVVSVGVHRIHQKSFIPLEPLLAAHSRSHAGSLFHQKLEAASFYSSQLKKHAQK